MGIYFQNVSADIVAGVVLVLATVYLYIKYWSFRYWKRRGINSMEPSFPMGNFGPALMKQKSFAELFQDLYDRSNARFFGIHILAKPVLILRDPELIHNVCVRDFAYFTDRGTLHDVEREPYSGNLFNMQGEKWKKMRTTLTPVFTSGKLKGMFSTLLTCGESLQGYMQKVAANGEVVEFREISSRYTTDVIASVSFGADVNTINDPDAPFRKFGRLVFALTLKNGIRNFILFLAPEMLKYSRIKLLDNEVETFLNTMVQQTIDHREKNNVTRKDLFQLLLQLRNTGNVKSDSQWDAEPGTNENKSHLTFSELAAQVFLFYAAGFETSASTLSFCIYELAKNPELLRKAQSDVDEVLKRNNNEITYQSISEAKYLDCCISETLRKYPPAPFLNRVCNKDYQIPGTNTIIEKGTALIVPTLGLHRDAQYYPDPNHFNPDRFIEENINREQPYLPFGEGPRKCIGMRLGLMQVKLALLMLLQKFDFKLNEDMSGTMVFSSSSFALTPVDGIKLKVTQRA